MCLLMTLHGFLLWQGATAAAGRVRHPLQQPSLWEPGLQGLRDTRDEDVDSRPEGVRLIDFVEAVGVRAQMRSFQGKTAHPPVPCFVVVSFSEYNGSSLARRTFPQHKTFGKGAFATQISAHTSPTGKPTPPGCLYPRIPHTPLRL